MHSNVYFYWEVAVGITMTFDFIICNYYTIGDTFYYTGSCVNALFYTYILD